MITAIVSLAGVVLLLITALCWCIYVIRDLDKKLSMYEGQLLPWDWEEEDG